MSRIPDPVERVLLPWFCVAKDRDEKHTDLMRGHLLAVAGHLHFGLGVLVHGDGEVQADIEDREQKEEEEGCDQEQRFPQHRPKKYIENKMNSGM
jgi:hypothetical protein